MHDYLATSNVELLLVLEVWPHWFSDRAQPDEVGSREHPVEWGSHFQECIRQLMLKDLADADISSITELNALSTSELKEHIAPLYGGLALVHEGTVLLQPGCWGNLSDVGSWVRILK